MALSVRTGTFGSYWGDTEDSSHALSMAQMQINSTFIYLYLRNEGWSDYAIAGILGNMEWESSMNPGRWQSNNVGNLSGGYGLVQWTPASNYINWATGDYSTMDNNLDRIIYELNNNLQYYPTADYPETFSEFTTSNKTPYYLACAFAWNYERSAVVISGTPEEQEALRQRRGNSANYWYTFLTGNNPPMPSNLRRKHFNFVLFNKRRRIKNG